MHSNRQTVNLGQSYGNEAVELTDYDIKRATSTFELMRHPFLPGHPLMDKVFICAIPEWDMPNKQLTLHIDDDTPTAVGSAELAGTLSALSGRSIRSVPEIRSGRDKSGYHLFSCGCFVNIDEQYVIFERTLTDTNGNILSWPQAKNIPIGRVDGRLADIPLKEMAEEIFLFNENGAGENAVIQPYHIVMKDTGECGIDLSTKRQMFRELSDELFLETKQVKEMKLLHATVDEALMGGAWDVITTYKGQVLDSQKLLVVYSSEERTVEMAKAIRLDIPDTRNLKIYSFEPHARPAQTISKFNMAGLILDWAHNEKTVFDKRMGCAVPIGGGLPIMNALCGLEEAHTTPQSLRNDSNALMALWDCSLRI